MALILTEEQELLKETAREFVRDNSPVAELRKLRDENDPAGYSKKLWKEMAELGWSGIPFPEDLGGADLGYAELGVILEELGRTLVATPFTSTVLLGGAAVLLGGNDAQKKDLIPGICAGEKILALAFQESARFDPYRIAARAESVDGGYRLSGDKRFVRDGHVADTLVVAARTSGAPGDRDGITLFLVDRGASGVDVTRTIMVDSRYAATVRLEGVEVDENAVLDRGGGAERTPFSGCPASAYWGRRICST